MKQHSDIPEWSLDDREQEPDTYRFSNVNPRSVFLLAMATAFLAVACIYAGYLLVNAAIQFGYIPLPPMLQDLVP